LRAGFAGDTALQERKAYEAGMAHNEDEVYQVVNRVEEKGVNVVTLQFVKVPQK